MNFSDRMKMYGVDRPREEAPMELDRTLEGNARIKVVGVGAWSSSPSTPTCRR